MKKQIVTLSLMLAITLTACGNANDNTAAIPEGMALDIEELTTGIETVADEDSVIDVNNSDEEENGNLTREQALAAVKNYCYSVQPNIEKLDKSDKYDVYFEVESYSDDEIVVLFTANTGEEVRFYVDPVSGDANITAFIPGVSTQEEPSDEIIHLKKYLDGPVELTGSVSLDGMWATASMVPDENGDVQPEWYVEFEGYAINYGHMEGDKFVVDHSDDVQCQMSDSDGNLFVQAENADGIQYTYRVSGDDKDVLEYYETWNEDEYADTYSGSTSLSRQK
ncbi:MAG: hypothetical protein J6I66_07955 [Lachnospiraceae bacterium]|nr:hypothetical protein [Lachnospiraceae bacterium]